MNLTFHIIRKDLRALRWGLLLWVAACFAHLGLRLAQHARGDAAELTPFWRQIETTDRWDHWAVMALPILLIPLLLHIDPLRGALSFWKSVPIGKWRLLTAKFSVLIVLFVALPLVCEMIYFLRAGLSVVLGTALADWAWRFLPGVGAAVLGCLFTRSLRVGVPGVAIALAAAVWMFQWPNGRDRIAEPLLVGRPAAPGTIPPPAGARIEVEPKSVHFERFTLVEAATPTTPKRSQERVRLSFTVHTAGLPNDVVVRSVAMRPLTMHLPGRTYTEPTPARSGPVYFDHFNLPLQEQRADFGRNSFAYRDLGANRWAADGDTLPMTARDLPEAGVLVESGARVSLARRRLVATIPIEENAAWQPGLHRFILSNVADPNAIGVRFRGTLATILADPRGATGGLALTPNTRFGLWLEHTSLPYRKYIQAIGSELWRNTRSRGARAPFAGVLHLSPSNFTDLTRSRRRTQIEASFDPVDVLQNEATPLQVARFAEEQAQVRNWRLAIVTYEDLGTIEVPLKTVVARPPNMQSEEEREELNPPAPSLGKQLAEVVVPPNPSPDEARRIFTRLVEICERHPDSSLRSDENTLYKKLFSLGPDNLDVLLSALTAAAATPQPYSESPRHRNHWLLRSQTENPFWRRVIIVVSDLARPTDQALVLKHHTPRVSLLRAIEPHGWENAALPAMCAMAGEEPVPPAWRDVFVRHPSPLTQAALLAQIRQRAVSVEEVAELITAGALPARESASVLWETALANTSALDSLTSVFALAAKHGVDVIPRDLRRILRLDPNQASQFGNNAPFKTRQSAFTQSFSLRSACPPGVSEAATWLEQNALLLAFNESTGRYELPGQVAPAPDLTAWGRLFDPLGTGRAAIENGALQLTIAGTRADFLYQPASRAALRVLREVEGDFTAEVTVDPTFDLAPEWTRRDNSGITYSRSETGIFESAGLLVLAGNHRYIRWEHGLWKNVNGHQLREENMRSGRNIVSERGTPKWDRSKPVRLRVARHGDFITTAWSQDGGPWFESPAATTWGWPRKVAVGPMMVSTVSRPFTARFTDYRLEPASAPPARIGTPPSPHPLGPPTATGTDLAGWGAVENPIGAGICTLEGNALSIAVAPGYADYHIQQRLSAPRVMRTVEGDFTLEVTLAPTPRLQWSSAEVLLRSGPDSYVRIGVASHNGNKPHFTYDRAFEGNPAPMLNLSAPRDLTKPLRLRLQRRGWSLYISHQQEGGDWTEFYPHDLRRWPAAIEVGFVALNTSKELFTARFSDLKITRE